MTFEDLPNTWRDQPLSDPSIAVDVVDLLVTQANRHDGAFYILICDDQDRLRVPVAIDEIDPDQPEDCAPLLRPFLEAMQAGPGGGVLLALGRPGSSEVTEVDREWARVAVRACEQAGGRFLGLYVAGPGGVLRVEVDSLA
jgi:hypothetical protein